MMWQRFRDLVACHLYMPPMMSRLSMMLLLKYQNVKYHVASMKFRQLNVSKYNGFQHSPNLPLDIEVNIYASVVDVLSLNKRSDFNNLQTLLT